MKPIFGNFRLFNGQIYCIMMNFEGQWRFLTNLYIAKANGKYNLCDFVTTLMFRFFS